MQEQMGNHTAIPGTTPLSPLSPADPEQSPSLADEPKFEIVRSAAEKAEPLSPEERRRLELCEKTIREGMGTFVAVGTALMEIRDARLYRQTHPSFGDYVRSVLALSRPRAYELIDSAQVMRDLSGVEELTALPQNEAQARELRRWRTPAERVKKWKTVLKRADDQPLTAQYIRRVLTPASARQNLPNPAQVCLKRLRKLASNSRNELSALKFIGRLEELFATEPGADAAAPKNEMWLPGF